MLNPAIVSRIDDICNDNDLSRSEFINGILADYCLKHDYVDSFYKDEVQHEQLIIEGF